MWSSEGKPADTEASTGQILHATSSKWEEESEREPIFKLIDNLLSFEACLYHQILPLRLEENQLLLGMVHAQDGGALDYVSRIVSYLNYTITTQEIAAETHRSILSLYLSYKNTFSSDEQQIETPQINTDLEENTDQQTEEIGVSTQTLEQTPPLKAYQRTRNHIEIPTPDNKPPFSDVTVLQLHSPEVFTPTDSLTNLPPKQLLEELLARVLSGGIGRLYLERQPYQGRIIWSDNGVLQSVLENIPLSGFQGVLNELKRFVALPVTRHAEPRQVEKECLYQQTRVLLRIRVMPGSYGEEATLQVLRGAALKFYQQQQVIHLSRDIIGISQQLSHKLHELNQRLLLNPALILNNQKL